LACAWNEDPSFLFIHIPKTGGTSFISNRSSATKELKETCPLMNIASGHRTLHYLSTKMDISKYFKFSIIRNPFDRFISLWKVQNLSTGISFNTFINLVDQKKYGWYPLKPQSFWITNKENKLLTDHLIRFENYTKGINKVLKTLSLPSIKLPHLRKLDRLTDYKPYYNNSEQIDKVAKIYSIDLKNFGYSF
jgi:hypothetical protein